MRKLLCSLTILALTFTAVGAFAATKPTLKKVPKTTKGSPAHVTGGIHYEPHSLAQFKAQNHLSYATNQKILNSAKLAKKGGYVNGTIDTIPYFSSWFITGSRNSIYPYAMVGQNPAAGGTTSVNTEIIPLASELDFGGVPIYVFDPSGLLVPPADQDTDTNLLLQSPLFDASTTYPGPPAQTGQVVDTAQRTEFRTTAAANWHTVMNAAPGPFVWLQFLEFNNGDWTTLCCDPNGNQVPVFNINTISNNFAFILSYPGETAGTTNNVVPVFLTDYLTAFDPSGGCCILGYHTAQPGVFDPAGILVWTWGTYIPHNLDQGLLNPFGGNFGSDSMVLSHEISELFNDPFVNTNVSPWVDGSVSFGQANLETGDTIEAMAPADVIYNVPLNTTTGPYTYTLQNVSTLEWFTRNPFNGGIYSWPNEGSLSHSPHPVGCTFITVNCYNYGQGSAAFFFGPPY
jgi:hypothetical protein